MVHILKVSGQSEREPTTVVPKETLYTYHKEQVGDMGRDFLSKREISGRLSLC